jgi:hypothetical protein
VCRIPDFCHRDDDALKAALSIARDLTYVRDACRMSYTRTIRSLLQNAIGSLIVDLDHQVPQLDHEEGKTEGTPTYSLQRPPVTDTAIDLKR